MTMSRASRRSIVAAVAVLVLLEVGARFLAPHRPGRLIWDTEFSQTKAAQIHDLGAADVAFVGSSIVNAGVDGPTVTGAVPWLDTSYNAGLPATTPRTWEVWADDLVFSELCPDVLVLGVSIRDVNDHNPGADNRRAAYSASAGRQELYGAAPGAASLEERVGDWSAFVRIRSRLREPGNVVLYFLTGRVASWPDPNLTPEGRYQGFDDDFYTQDDQRDEDLRTGALADFAMGGEEFDALARIIERGQTAGATVVVVEMPSMRTDLAELVPEGTFERFGGLVDGLAEEYGVPVWRFSELDDRADHFGDLYHLNGTGTTELSEMLGRRLAEAHPTGVAEATCLPAPGA